MTFLRCRTNERDERQMFVTDSDPALPLLKDALAKAGIPVICFGENGTSRITIPKEHRARTAELLSELYLSFRQAFSNF